MLRVGLTGGLGSGKSTAAKMFAAKGAHVLSSDEIGRDLMQPGQAVYAAIVQKFGPAVVCSDGSLDRRELARVAFDEERIEELNAIVHPAVIARQAELIEQIGRREPDAIAMVESALIFETKHGGQGGWHQRFDTVICVTAPEEQRIVRFVERMAGREQLSQEARKSLEAEARRRIANQRATEQNTSQCQYVLRNDGPLADLQAQVDVVWLGLKRAVKRPASV